ncbi:hypothetical protein DFP72DRAFT_845261 [Ephemerocybe angulata]|uniref:Uncharacterized protein n=1 Tax=Ephemerocybe angulata TaxID=980116 RepID=A0A8H6I5L4_9AGAR|nr:hypothetical protein DFP72DRAFT_845261 [Tulosesus angulatus]
MHSTSLPAISTCPCPLDVLLPRFRPRLKGPSCLLRRLDLHTRCKTVTIRNSQEHARLRSNAGKVDDVRASDDSHHPNRRKHPGTAWVQGFVDDTDQPATGGYTEALREYKALRPPVESQVFEDGNFAHKRACDVQRNLGQQSQAITSPQQSRPSDTSVREHASTCMKWRKEAEILSLRRELTIQPQSARTTSKQDARCGDRLQCSRKKVYARVRRDFLVKAYDPRAKVNGVHGAPGKRLHETSTRPYDAGRSDDDREQQATAEPDEIAIIQPCDALSDTENPPTTTMTYPTPIPRPLETLRMPTTAVLDSSNMEHPARPPSTMRRTHKNDVRDVPRTRPPTLQQTPTLWPHHHERRQALCGTKERASVTKRARRRRATAHDEDDPLDGTMSTDPRRRRRRMHLDLDDSQHAAPCQVPVNDAQNTRTTWKTYCMPASHPAPTFSTPPVFSTAKGDEDPFGKPPGRQKEVRKGQHELDDVHLAYLGVLRAGLGGGGSRKSGWTTATLTRSTTATNVPRPHRLLQLYRIACENTINDAPGTHERHRRLTANATPSKPRRLTTTNDDENPSRSRPARRKNVCQCRHDLDDVRMTDLCNMRAALDDDEDEEGWWWKGGKCGGERYGRGDAAKRERLVIFAQQMTGRTAELEKTSFVHSEVGVAMRSLVQGRNLIWCQEYVKAKRSDWKCELLRLGVSEARIRCRRGKDGVSVQGKLRELHHPRPHFFILQAHHISTPIQPTHNLPTQLKPTTAAVNTRNRISMPAPPSRTSILPSKLATRILHTRYVTPSPATRHPGHRNPSSPAQQIHIDSVEWWGGEMDVRGELLGCALCQDSDGPFGSTSAPSERVIWAQLGYKLMLIQEDVIGDLQMSEDYFSFGD